MDDTKPSSCSSASQQKDKQPDINSLPQEAMSLSSSSSSSNEHFSAADYPEQPNQPLTAELLAEQNELYSSKLEPKPNAIRAWAADLPEVPDSVQPILTTTHIFEMESLTLDDEEEEEEDEDEAVRQDHHQQQPKIQETKDVFSETQKVAYVSLCYLTSLEVVYDFQGRDFTYARMSADNWQRKLMRMLYCHMDISADGEYRKWMFKQGYSCYD